MLRRSSAPCSLTRPHIVVVVVRASGVRWAGGGGGSGLMTKLNAGGSLGAAHFFFSRHRASASLIRRERSLAADWS